MIIKSMTFTNFRQFYDENSVEFGTESDNVTLIIGANGNGKTGIFRALMFVLYGDTSLEQDNHSSGIHLVNLDKLEEQKNQPVDAVVELEFEHKNQNYVIKRKMTSIQTGKEIINKEFHPELFTFSETGDYIPYTQEQVDTFINRIIEPEIREFFFFDAERMQLLDTTKSEKALSKDIKEGIIRLLQLKYIEESITELNKLIKQKQTEINKQIKDEEIDHKLTDKKTKERSLTEEETSLDNYRNEKRGLQKEIDAIKTKLSENSEIKELQEKLEKEEELLSKTYENRNLHKENMKNQIKQGIHYLSSDLLASNKVFFNEHINNSTDKVPHNLLKQSIHDMSCAVCRTEFTEQSSQHLVLKKMIENYESSSVTTLMTDILTTYDDLSKNENRYISKIESTIQKLTDNKDEMEGYDRAIENLQDEIGDRASNINNLKHLENQLTIYYKELDQINENISKSTLRIQHLTDSLNKLEQEIDKLTEKYGKVSKDKSIKLKLEHFKGIIEETMHDYSSYITEELSNEIYRSFISLLDKKDRANYKEVIITEDYEIRLINQLGQNVVQDLSMGQGQIFSLAFILSLAKLASKGRTEINFPLFMDTPFARLSRDNRDNLIRNIPSLTNQWILLLTDTEFTQTEKEIFEEVDKVGKIYSLINVDGKTRIRQYNSLPELKMEV